MNAYYLIYPDFPGHVAGWVRADGKLVPVPVMNGHVSPRLGWRFEIHKGVVRVFGPDGCEFHTPVTVYDERDAARRAAGAAESARDEARKDAEQVRQAEEQARQAEAAAAAERDSERGQAARLAAKLRELGLDPDAV